MVAHLSSLAGLMGMPFGHVIGPLIVYLSKPDESEFVREHARASLNFQLTLFIFAIPLVIAAILVWIVGLLAMPGVRRGRPSFVEHTMLGPWIVAGLISTGALIVTILIGSLVLVIMGAAAASDGRSYRYPFAIPFFKNKGVQP